MSVKNFVESIVSQITVSGDTFAFAHGEKDFQNLFSDEAVYPIVYLDEPIQNDFQIVSSGAIQEYYPIQLMILYKTELDFTPDQHDVLIQKARLCARKFLTLAGMSQQVRELDSIKGIEVINVFDANTSGIVLSCRLSFYDSTSICADYDPVQGFVVLTNSNDSWSDQAQNNTTYIVPNTVFEILDQNGDNYGEYSVPSVNGGAVTISVAPCDLATYQNSDGSFIQTIASGDTFVSDDITVNVYDQNETLVASETVSSNINVDLTVNIPEIEVNADVLNTLGEIVATKLVTPTDNEITAPDGSVHLKKENDGSITTLSIPSGATENYVVQNNDITVNGANGFEIHATDPLDVRLRNESNQVVQPISVTHAGNHATIILPTNEIDVTINGITVVDDAVSDVALTLVDQNGDDVPFTQTGNELEVQVGEWVRPTDWLPIPAPTSGATEVYVLYAVLENELNFVTIAGTTTGTLNWGDGTPTLWLNGTSQNNIYDYNTLSGSVNVNEFGENYKQVLIKLEFTVPGSFMRIDRNGSNPLLLNKVSSLMQITVYGDKLQSLDCGFNRFQPYFKILDVSQATNVSINGNSVQWSSRVNLEKYLINPITTVVLTDGLRNNLRIKNFGDFNSLTTDSTSFFNLSNVETINNVNLTNTTSLQSTFRDCELLKSIGNINAPLATNVTSAFRGCRLLRDLGDITISSNITSLVEMFFSCTTLRRIVFTNSLINVTNVTTFINGCVNLRTLITPDLRLGLNIANNQMSATALNSWFTSLGTAAGSQTITVTGNPGAATCNPSIATAKGFTVVI